MFTYCNELFNSRSNFGTVSKSVYLVTENIKDSLNFQLHINVRGFFFFYTHQLKVAGMGFQFCVFRSVIKEIEKKYETLLLTFINVIHAGKITQHFQINQ